MANDNSEPSGSSRPAPLSQSDRAERMERLLAEFRTLADEEAATHQDVDSPWTIGSDLALALLEDAHDIGQAASLEAQYREIGKPQNNFVLRYLDQAARAGDRRATEAFAAVLSEYISSCQTGGVPDVDFLREIAKAPPGPGTGEMAESDATETPEQPAAAVEALHNARSNAQMTAYDARFLVEAAHKLNANGAEDRPLEQVLEAARAKLVALTAALDSVNFGKGGAL